MPCRRARPEIPGGRAEGRTEIPLRPVSEGVTQMATQTAGPAAAGEPAGAAAHLLPPDRVELLLTLLLMRASEARAHALYRQGRVPGSFYDGFGQEAVSVGAAFAMGPRDRLCPLHRDLGAHLVRGVAPARIQIGRAHV